MTAENRTRWRPNAWTVAWIIWILAFFVIEGIALFRKPLHDTLSEQWWGVFKVREKVSRRNKVLLLLVQFAILLPLFGWLSGHLPFAIWR